MKRIIVSTLALAAVVLGGTACESLDSGAGKTHAERIVEQQNKQNKQAKGDDAQPAAVKKGPDYTTAQEQAIGSASDYLDFSAFSRSGLIDQLKYEGFKLPDATFAVNHMKVDYNVQAVGSAKDYLKTSSFSRAGLIEQLKYEGFTQAQAIYGVNHVGL